MLRNNGRICLKDRPSLFRNCADNLCVTMLANDLKLSSLERFRQCGTSYRTNRIHTSESSKSRTVEANNFSELKASQMDASGMHPNHLLLQTGNSEEYERRHTAWNQKSVSSANNPGMRRLR